MPASMNEVKTVDVHTSMIIGTGKFYIALMSVLFTIVIQFGTTIWWASGINKQVTSNTELVRQSGLFERVSKLETDKDVLKDNQTQMVVKLEVLITEVKNIGQLLAEERNRALGKPLGK